jgi:hypothetical protein
LFIKAFLVVIVSIITWFSCGSFFFFFFFFLNQFIVPRPTQRHSIYKHVL